MDALSFVRVLRSGSRTVVVGATPDLVLGLASYGCRLMLVDPDAAQIQTVRERLHEKGMRSLVMGSQTALANLPEHRYEAVLVTDAKLGTPCEWLQLLERGGVLVAPDPAPEDLEVSRKRLPEGYWSYRTHHPALKSL